MCAGFAHPAYKTGRLSPFARCDTYHCGQRVGWNHLKSVSRSRLGVQDSQLPRPRDKGKVCVGNTRARRGSGSCLPHGERRRQDGRSRKCNRTLNHWTDGACYASGRSTLLETCNKDNARGSDGCGLHLSGVCRSFRQALRGSGLPDLPCRPVDAGCRGA